MSKILKLGEFEEQRRNGDKLRFVVQTAPPEMTEEIVQLMTKFFMTREPLTQVSVLGDPVSIEDLKNLWREEIPRGTSIVALEVRQGAKPKLFGVNVTPLSVKGEKDDSDNARIHHADAMKRRIEELGVNVKYLPPYSPQLNPAEKNMKGEHSKKLMKLLDEVTRMGNVYEKYGVDRYLTGMGLAVDPDYQGFNVGLRILECRRPLCQHLGVAVTATVFTAPASQHIAAKVGFETLAELEYATYEDNNREKPFASAPGKAVIMGLRF